MDLVLLKVDTTVMGKLGIVLVLVTSYYAGFLRGSMPWNPAGITHIVSSYVN